MGRKIRRRSPTDLVPSLAVHAFGVVGVSRGGDCHPPSCCVFPSRPLPEAEGGRVVFWGAPFFLHASRFKNSPPSGAHQVALHRWPHADGTPVAEAPQACYRIRLNPWSHVSNGSGGPRLRPPQLQLQRRLRRRHLQPLLLSSRCPGRPRRPELTFQTSGIFDEAPHQLRSPDFSSMALNTLSRSWSMIGMPRLQKVQSPLTVRHGPSSTASYTVPTPRSSHSPWRAS